MKDDMDFRFAGAGRYGDNFYNQFWLDEQQRYHREDGPAIIDAEGNRIWMIRDQRHRDGDLPAAEMKNGDRSWWFEGKLHREGNPAIVYADGREEWWTHGRKLTESEIEDQKASILRKAWAEQARRVEEEMRQGASQPVILLKPAALQPRP